MRFVSDKLPKDHAERLHELQQKLEDARAKVRTLEKEADQLKTYLLKVGKNKSFEFNGALYLKQFTVQRSTRMVIDTDEVKRLLKSRTPYKPAVTVKVTIDYVYKD